MHGWCAHWGGAEQKAADSDSLHSLETILDARLEVVLLDPETASPSTETPVFSVSELTRTIRSCLEQEIGNVWVEGEVSNFRHQSSGHQYFTLKDDRAQLACVLFRSNTGPRVKLADGMSVQAFGQLTVYEQRGQHQLVVQLVQPKGLGALQARFEALKRKLQAEGLFAADRKRALPRFPARVGIVTSPTGAALRDMLNILTRRAPWVRVLVNPVRVQGSGAATEIARAVDEFNEWRGSADRSVDLIIVARGGGSIEDLWEFNEEVLARSLAASRLPTVSAVGHEIDFTIADFVADLRAPTPSAAAELIAPDGTELRRQLAGTTAWLARRVADRLTQERERLRGLSRGALAREAQRRLESARQQVDLAEDALERGVQAGLNQARVNLARLSAGLAVGQLAAGIGAKRENVGHLRWRMGTLLAAEQEGRRARLERVRGLLRVLGPQATLERGYSITTDARGMILQSTAGARKGEALVTRLSDGEVRSTVD